MICLHERPKEKTAVALPGNTTASHKITQHTDGNAVPADMASRVLRVLHQRLTRLGLSYSSGIGDEIVIAGQSYDLRGATAMARQLGRAPT